MSLVLQHLCPSNLRTLTNFISPAIIISFPSADIHVHGSRLLASTSLSICFIACCILPEMYLLLACNTLAPGYQARLWQCSNCTQMHNRKLANVMISKMTCYLPENLPTEDKTKKHPIQQRIIKTTTVT